MKQLAQGDVLLVPVAQMKKRGRGTVEQVTDGVVALGEATGHAHRLAGKFSLMRFSGDPNEMFLDVPPGAVVELRHEEHSTLSIPPGIYRVVKQREYRFGEGRRVAD